MSTSSLQGLRANLRAPRQHHVACGLDDAAAATGRSGPQARLLDAVLAAPAGTDI